MTPITAPRIGIRWTIGDLKPRGFEALRLSILGAWKLFGTRAAYAVCVHTVPTGEVRKRVGPVPAAVAWVDVTPGWSRSFIFAHSGPGRADGEAWKLVPPRLFVDRFEIALDSTVILWERPAALEAWLEEAHPRRALLMDDPWPQHGAFARTERPRPGRPSIRGLPPEFDVVAAWRATLREQPAYLVRAADAHGLQVAALSRELEPRRVSLRDVPLCSPLPGHAPEVGRRGACFVGLEPSLPGRDAPSRVEQEVGEHWDRYRAELYRRLDAGLPLVPIAL
ncbi:MAG TPA: hypothetical protein VF310_00840 [Vicinamibacteria bacterium]